MPDPATPGSGAEDSSLFSHLIELRTRLLRSIVGVMLVLACLLPFTSKLYTWLAMPLSAER